MGRHNLHLSGGSGPEPIFRLSGDRGLLVEFGSYINPDLNRLTRNVAKNLEHKNLPGIVDVVPAYASLLVIYEPGRIGLLTMQDEVRKCWRQTACTGSTDGRIVDIPVCYSQSFGPDLSTVASHNKLSPEEVIRLHTAEEYLIYMIGFAPGFPYLGGLDPRLHTPRLDTPRPRVEAGSVGIANNQTGIYPIASPGGWRIIGRTPLRLFAPEKTDPVPYYRPGDLLKFVPISEEEFQNLCQEQDNG